MCRGVARRALGEGNAGAVPGNRRVARERHEVLLRHQVAFRSDKRGAAPPPWLPTGSPARLVVGPQRSRPVHAARPSGTVGAAWGWRAIANASWWTLVHNDQVLGDRTAAHPL